MSDEQLLDIFSEVPSVELARTMLEGDGMTAVDLLVAAKLAGSKGDARRTIQGGGMYLNNRRVTDVAQAVRLHEVIHGKFIVLRKGAKNYTLVRIR